MSVSYDISVNSAPNMRENLALSIRDPIKFASMVHSKQEIGTESS